MTKYTKESINDLMHKSPVFLERAIVKIWEYQTADEKSCEQTLKNNGVGFNGVDAKFLSSLVSWIDKMKTAGKAEGSRLTFKQSVVALKKMRKYAGQIAKISNALAEAKAQTHLGV